MWDSKNEATEKYGKNSFLSSTPTTFLLLLQCYSILAPKIMRVRSELKYIRYVNDVKWCRPSVFIVNFEHHAHLFLAISTGDFEQVIVCYIIFTPLYSDFVISSSCFSIYTFKAQRQIWDMLQGVSSQGV